MRIAFTFLTVVGLALMFVAATAQVLLAWRSPTPRQEFAEVGSLPEAPASWWHGRR